MPRTTIGIALLALVAAVPPAGATPAPTWLPTMARNTLSPSDSATAFPDGTGYVMGPGSDPDIPGRVVHRTADYGRTWTAGETMAPGLFVSEFYFTAPGIGWATDTFKPELARTTDGGRTWQARAAVIPGNPADFWLADFDASPGGGALLAAVNADAPVTTECGFGDRTEVSWSTDDGATWRTVRYAPSGEPGSVRVLSVEAADADTGLLLAGDDECDAGFATNVYVTRDAGATWRLRPAAATGTGITAATVSPDGRRIVVGYADGTVRVSTNGGRTFGAPVALARVHPYAPDGYGVARMVLRGPAGYAVLDDGGVHRTVDGGVTWTPDGVVGPVRTLAMFDAERAFVAGLAAVLTRLP